MPTSNYLPTLNPTPLHKNIQRLLSRVGVPKDVHRDSSTSSVSGL